MAADTSHAHSIITQKTDMDKILVLDASKLVNCVEVRGFFSSLSFFFVLFFCVC